MGLSCKIILAKHNLSLDLAFKTESRGITAIYGPSGTGKTTILKIIAGIERGGKGSSISLDNTVWQNDATFTPTHQRKLAYVFQQPRLFPHLTARGNLEFAYSRRRNSRGISISDAISQFGLSDFIDQFPDQLSGGQAQRVAIARALVSAPDMLLMDEPLAALDDKSRHELLTLLEGLHRQLSVPVIYVSHQLEEVARLADHAVLIEQGKTLAQGKLVDLCSRPELPIAQQSNSASLWEGVVSDQDQYQLTKVTVGHNIALWVSGKPVASGLPVRLRIPTNAVSISLQPTLQSSIINVLAAKVAAITQLGFGKSIVKLAVDDQILLASITDRSVIELDLKIGKQVFAQVKGVALLTDYG
jgi:molybdate transport system ATP-binding protein